MEVLKEKIQKQAGQLKEALARLNEVLLMEKNAVVRDSVIKRFEFSFELSWKLLKSAVELYGREANSPREAILVGAQIGLLEDPESWLDFLEARNLSSHVYDETTAEEIYSQIPNFYQSARNLLQIINQKT